MYDTSDGEEHFPLDFLLALIMDSSLCFLLVAHLQSGEDRCWFGHVPADNATYV
ncbi:hypothetical protein BDR05DRAFT_966313 [Suillus weaverae]|nr:hypothetical protein BDR05DRAFT_966313 [Suillus weaverae]